MSAVCSISLPKRVPQFIGGQWGGNLYEFFRYRMGEFHVAGVQGDAAVGV